MAAFPDSDAIELPEAPKLVVGLRHKGSLCFCCSLPRACVCMLIAVLIDIFVMLGYTSVLLSTGTNTAAFYFAALIFSSACILMYFSISGIRSENTVELLATIGIGTCVNATVFYVRANDNAFSAVERTSLLTSGSSLFNVSPDLFNAGVISAFALLQLGLMWFGYLSHRDFGWRIFKLFGIDFNMRQVYERFLWFAAMLKLDAYVSILNVAAGFAFFFRHLVGPLEHGLMIVGIAGNMVWVLGCFVAVKLEYRAATGVLLPLGLIPAGYVHAVIGHGSAVALAAFSLSLSLARSLSLVSLAPLLPSLSVSSLPSLRFPPCASSSSPCTLSLFTLFSRNSDRRAATPARHVIALTFLASLPPPSPSPRTLLGWQIPPLQSVRSLHCAN